MPTVAFQPGPTKLLKERFAAALNDHYVLGEYPHEERPGAHRKHVFDFSDGTRLIVSRETLGQYANVIHVSGSVEPNVMSAELLEEVCKRPRPWFLSRWRILSHRNDEPLETSQSQAGVLHMLFETQNK